ncbi:malto-oligosyltrehalose synthase [Chrysosporum bergii ANA360D]|uniref:Malto-oligosyltrehalose synthase n=1 Tax=Chrysosporum bergii ANA360D TaxID=617107 RepID=A0AA43GU87_9CYAN|nr:malto-oligosyltrehalose synthase [Chrysosporum bergii]MDH6061746.1 malto-oligosyltrehalose synthase [Chrysosporum bergii ANA360D]
MGIPTATYRLQFNYQFGFNAAKEIIQYLDQLGISDLYASPIFKARIGSSHGYDVVDPNQLNPELGTEEDFTALLEALKQHQMGWLQDIVPNHMAYDSQNEYLMDVLENGVNSVYANYFDIAWNTPIMNGWGDGEIPILAPLLGNFYGESLENGEIQLKYDQYGLSVNYYNLRFPLKLESYATFLNQNIGKLSQILGRNNPIFVRFLGMLYMLKHIPSDINPKERQDQINFVKGLLWELYTDNREIKNFIDENIQVFNGEKGKPDSFNLLDNLLSEQFYRLAFWKVGAEEINYRRFFTINELISVNVENFMVFENTHALMIKLVKQNQITGLRIDHIDGLYNPTQYLQRLREKVGDIYIIVEKILHPGEDLPNHWSIQGTTGYDFLNYLNGVFCQTASQAAFTQIYWNVTGLRTAYEQIAVNKKHLILERNLAGDVDNLTYILKRIASKHRYGNDFTINGLKRAIAEILTLFPIYRTYTNQDGILPTHRQYIQDVIHQAKSHLPLLHHELNFIEKLLLLEYENYLTPEDQEQWLYFVMRLQQYTGPLMAKGVEDTALYVYNRFISLNEVGGDPDNFGISITNLHDFNQQRNTRWRHSMSATSTHDTKRGEDIRARLNVLSEIPQEWQKQVDAFCEINRVHKTTVNKRLPMPDSNDEYQFYQMLLGAFPFFEHEYHDFCQRIQDYVLKAAREAKVYTAWLRPNQTYENALTKFVTAVLEPGEQNQFLQQFLPFQKQVAYYGMFNSLSQTLLKITSPGVPDFYQGTELWDFSMVDPDNRRPVDFEIRQSYLQMIKEQAQADIMRLIDELLATKEDSRIKLFLITQALKARKENLIVFQQGDYVPLAVRGKHSDHIIAFARSDGHQTMITIAPRFFTRLIQPGEYPLGLSVWDDTHIQLPPAAPSHWQNTITGQMVKANNIILVGEALQHFPVALCCKL